VKVLEILKLNKKGFKRFSNSASRKRSFEISSNLVIVKDDVLRDHQTQYIVEDEILRDFSYFIE